MSFALPSRWAPCRVHFARLLAAQRGVATRGRCVRPAYATVSSASSGQEALVTPDTRAAGVSPVGGSFYAQSAASHEALGLLPAVADALRRAGFAAPARAQELAVPVLLSGRDLVFAAETGSGKTLSYLAPIVDALLRAPQAAADDADDGPGRPRGRTRPLALVLCPNTALCHQVLAVLASLRDADGAPLLRGVHVSSGSPPPYEAPEVVVSTPGGLMALLRTAGAHYGGLWTPEGLGGSVTHLVVDEADLLITGAYAKDLTQLLDMVKVGERRRLEAQVAAELGISLEAMMRLPRNIRAACWQSGVPGMVAAGYQPPAGAAGKGRAFGPYRRCQHVFVAATLPNVTKADVGVELQQRFKDAVWVRGDLLHRSQPSVTHRWLDTQPREWAHTLAGAVLKDPDYLAGAARILVFAKDTVSADKASGVLQHEAIAHVVYHKHVPLDKRAAALREMAAPGRGNAVMVSTDAAARGIDLPGITHVIQADFAATAVDFLHRVGRTARAGAAGKVTSLVTPDAEPLARVLQEYVEAGRPVEDAFSRNRSFSRKLKRYGEFVPRGQTAAARGGGSDDGRQQASL